jgi:hypothetical protein
MPRECRESALQMSTLLEAATTVVSPRHIQLILEGDIAVGPKSIIEQSTRTP